MVCCLALSNARFAVREYTATRVSSTRQMERCAMLRLTEQGQATPIFYVENTLSENAEWLAMEDLVGKQVLAVVNFPPGQIADFKSEILVRGFRRFFFTASKERIPYPFCHYEIYERDETEDAQREGLSASGTRLAPTEAERRSSTLAPDFSGRCL